MLENFQGDSWGSIPPLRMPSLLPHDLCHGRSSSLWLPAVIEFQLSYSRSWKMMLWKVLHSVCNMQYAICTQYSICRLPAGIHSLFQGIFSTQGLNPSLPHCRQILYCLSHQESPTILEWVAYPFSSRSSQTRNRTGVSCIAGGFFLPSEWPGKIQ